MSVLKTAAAVIAIAAVCFLIARGNKNHVFVLVTVGLTAIACIGLNVLLGLNGQISLGHVAFYAIGAYTVGILTTNYEWSFWPAFVLSGVNTGLAGMLLAIPALRVRGPYLAMVTIAFGFVVEQGLPNGRVDRRLERLVRHSRPERIRRRHRRARHRRSDAGRLSCWRPPPSLGLPAAACGATPCARYGIPELPASRSGSIRRSCAPRPRHFGGGGRLGRRRLVPRSATSSAQNPFRSFPIDPVPAGGDAGRRRSRGRSDRRRCGRGAVAGTLGHARPISAAVRRGIDARRASGSRRPAWSG